VFPLSFSLLLLSSLLWLASLLLFNIHAVVCVSSIADVLLLCLVLLLLMFPPLHPCCGWLPAVSSSHAVVVASAGVGSLLLTLFY
jgi:hypothetical protein